MPSKYVRTRPMQCPFYYGETGELGFSYPDHKDINALSFRAYIPYKSEVNVEISYDDGPWKDRGTYRGTDRIETYAIQRPPETCDHFRLRFSGHGKVRIYAITITTETTSEDRPYGSAH